MVTQTYTQPDGTRQPRDERFQALMVAINSQEPLRRGTQGWLDDYSAAQLGLYQILVNLTFHTIDRVALVDKGRIEANSFQIQEVYLDFPDPEDERVPTPSVTITQSADTDYVNPYGQVAQELIDDTLGLYGEGTVLQKLYEPEYRFSLVCYLATKDDRAAVRKRLTEVFGVDIQTDRMGRRIALPWYFDRVCRYNLSRVSYPDDAAGATSQTWPLVVEIVAQLPAVQLVEAPPCMRIPPQAVAVE